MASIVLKIKSNEAALTVNNTVSNSLTTISLGTVVRLYNSNTTTPMVATLYSSNSANLNQSFQYANVTIPPSADLIIRKTSTDKVNGNAAILATMVTLG